MQYNRKNIFFFFGGIILLTLLYFESIVKAEMNFDIFVRASELAWKGNTCYDVWIPVGERPDTIHNQHKEFAR